MYAFPSQSHSGTMPMPSPQPGYAVQLPPGSAPGYPLYMNGQQIQQSSLLGVPGHQHHHQRTLSNPSPAAHHHHHHHHRRHSHSRERTQSQDKGFFSNLFGLGSKPDHQPTHHTHHHHQQQQQHVHYSHHHSHSSPNALRPVASAVPMVQHHSHPVQPQHHSHPVQQPQHHQQHIPSSPHFQYSKCTGRKKALCIGINYLGKPHELKGCINDARHMRDFLIKRHGYRSEDIVLLTDDSHHTRQLPTRRNIIDAMRWLVSHAHPHDSLFFHYSGHGGQTRDQDGDEVDGRDEVIYPLDFEKRGHIVDDEMHDLMVRPLPVGCRLTAVFDSCHSGTVLDLPYIYSSTGRMKGTWVSAKRRKDKSSNADVISWSGCKDGQKSADTFHGGVAVGAMSYAFITSLANNPNQSYQQLLKDIRNILYPKYSQKPQLGSSHPINTNLRFII